MSVAAPHAEPQPRELDALLSVGEVMSCTLAAMAVHELGGRAVSLTGSQAGIFTNESHCNARILQISPQRIIEARQRDINKKPDRRPTAPKVNGRR